MCDNMGVVEEVRQHKPNGVNKLTRVRHRLFNNSVQKRDAVLTVNTSDKNIPSMGQGKQCTVRFKKRKSEIWCDVGESLAGYEGRLE